MGHHHHGPTRNSGEMGYEKALLIQCLCLPDGRQVHLRGIVVPRRLMREAGFGCCCKPKWGRRIGGGDGSGKDDEGICILMSVESR